MSSPSHRCTQARKFTAMCGPLLCYDTYFPASLCEPVRCKTSTSRFSLRLHTGCPNNEARLHAQFPSLHILVCLPSLSFPLPNYLRSSTHIMAPPGKKKQRFKKLVLTPSPPSTAPTPAQTRIILRRNIAAVAQDADSGNDADVERTPVLRPIRSKTSTALNPSAPNFRTDSRSEFPSLGGGTQQPGPSAGTWGMRQRSPERRPYGRGMVCA